ncbi:MAG: GNAT family N-acetyltransferase [Candidatus Cloacimonetes bacterium]|nr:GNAT family N-acetyltransferase [Candidatus Cloacimonadota bacterium]
MIKTKYIYDYKDVPHLRNSFNQLANSVFGIDFEKWYSYNFWTDNYICHSFCHNDKIVSNVSVSELTAIISGKKLSALQIGTVMTHPEYRNNGYASQLMQKVLQKYSQKVDLIYLFPEEHARDFYLKYGFSETCDSRFLWKKHHPIKQEINKRKLALDKSTDRDLLLNICKQRKPLSEKFSIENSAGIITWYCTNMFADNIYYVEDCNAVVICKYDKNSLFVYDIIFTGYLDIASFIRTICHEETCVIHLFFTPDFLDKNDENVEIISNESIFYKSSTYRFPKIFSHPITSHA